VTDGGTAVINVGDSRAYLIRGGSIEQITRDHSVVEDMVRRGEITREEARGHPNKNLITRALGTGESVEADVFRPELKRGDYLLLCSDGLSNTVEDSELCSISRRGPDIRTACEKLLELSLSRGAPIISRSR
jgi:protein phosphatase